MTVTETPPPNTEEPKPTRTGRLLALIRKFIDYAKDLAATVRERVTTDPIFAKTKLRHS